MMHGLLKRTGIGVLGTYCVYQTVAGILGYLCYLDYGDACRPPLPIVAIPAAWLHGPSLLDLESSRAQPGSREDNAYTADKAARPSTATH